MEQVRALLKEPFCTNGWELQNKNRKEKFYVEKRISPNFNPLIRAQCQYDHDALTIFRAYTDFNNRVKYDPNV
jgi:hypothetical protein|tara:strand:- start:530 stop:748 length:219 start_codon:yes stop_codon:yes gene_type:complete